MWWRLNYVLKSDYGDKDVMVHEHSWPQIGYQVQPSFFLLSSLLPILSVGYTLTPYWEHPAVTQSWDRKAASPLSSYQPRVHFPPVPWRNVLFHHCFYPRWLSSQYTQGCGLSRTIILPEQRRICGIPTLLSFCVELDRPWAPIFPTTISLSVP